MRIAIYQPRYFPQLHYFNRALTSDVFVLLDSAQYTKSLVHSINGKNIRYKSYQADTPIKSPDGVHLLTIPLKDHMLPLSETKIEYSSPWPRKHIATIKSFYGGSPYGDQIVENIRALLSERYDSLGALNSKTFLWGITKILGGEIPVEKMTIETVNRHLARSSFKLKRIVTVSDVGVERPSGIHKGTEWTIRICKALGATEYLHGRTAQFGYMDESQYKKNGISLLTQDWQRPSYRQKYTEKSPFISNLSIIDLLCNVHTEEARRVVYPE